MKVSLVITKGTPEGPPRDRRVMEQVWYDVAHTEHGYRMQAHKLGRFQLDVDADGQLTGESVNLGSEQVWFSPSLAGLQLSHFPDDATFGNSTGSRYVRFDGEDVLVNHTVFPYDTDFTQAMLDQMVLIFEGDGSGELNVWHPIVDRGVDFSEFTFNPPSPLKILKAKRDRTLAEANQLIDLMIG
jgi:hypothetical protein